MHNFYRKKLKDMKVKELINYLNTLREENEEKFKDDWYVTNELDKIDEMIENIEEVVEFAMCTTVTIDELS